MHPNQKPQQFVAMFPAITAALLQLHPTQLFEVVLLPSRKMPDLYDQTTSFCKIVQLVVLQSPQTTSSSEMRILLVTVIQAQQLHSAQVTHHIK